MSEAERRASLTIDSRLENVALVGTAIHAWCDQAGLPSQTVRWIELCVVEAVNNSIAHAYERRGDQTIRIALAFSPGHVRIDVVDWGHPMDPARLDTARQHSPSFDPADVEHLPVSGMGLGLILRTMDAVTYDSENGMNTLSMVKYFDMGGSER